MCKSMWPSAHPKRDRYCWCVIFKAEILPCCLLCGVSSITMALSNPGTSAALEPEPRAAVTTTTSPLRSSAAAAGFTAYASTVQDVRPKTNSQQQCSSLPRPSFNLDLAPFHHPSINEAAKEATTHDFLSLYGSTSLGGQTNAGSARGTQSSVTLDFLQPLEKSGKVAVNSILSHALVPAPAPVNRVRTSVTGNHGGSQETGYALVNGTLELPSNVLFRMEGSEGGNDGVKERLEKYGYWSSVQLKFGSSDLAYTSKAMPSHAHLETSQQLPSNLNKQWHQTGTELFDTAKKPPRVPSEDDEDEDEDYPDRNRDQKKDCLFQRSDTSQKLDGKGNDGKASTPRSKHSATEQRRRSKINDRFQMLRQLVPNNDQKRDKASFLLEVIEYIQFLQEKVRKHEAAEHGRQQERLKNMSWDACQRSTGVRETTTDAPRMDSLVYGKEHIPIVSTVPFEMKQVTDANGLLRPRLSPVVASSDHEVSATDLPMSKGHVAMHLDRPSQAFQGRLPNNENKSVITKPIPATFSTEHSAYPMFGRNSSHMIHSGPKPASEAHTVPSCHENQGFPPITKSKVPSCSKVEVANLSQAAGNNLPPQILSSVGDQNQIELKSRQPESCQQDANSRQQNEDLSTVQHAGASPSARQMPNGNSTVSESSNDIHDTVPQKPESLQKVEVQVEGKQPLNIQGGVINVSSVYSQGLLNTLTRALQSSGLDLSQASISVQIDLGKPGDGVVATNSTKAAISPEVSQQAPGHLKHSRPSPESEHLSKKPKIEVDC